MYSIVRFVIGGLGIELIISSIASSSVMALEFNLLIISSIIVLASCWVGQADSPLAHQAHLRVPLGNNPLWKTQ